MALIAGCIDLRHLNPSIQQAAREPEVAAKLADAACSSFSCMVANGRGELMFRRRAGVWHHRTSYVDRCFGTINQKWQPVPAGRG